MDISRTPFDVGSVLLDDSLDLGYQFRFIAIAKFLYIDEI